MQVRETLDSLSRGTGLKVGYDCNHAANPIKLWLFVDRHSYRTAFFRAGTVNAGG
jgi:hypothetical protein